jgi:cell division protein FtsB
LTDRFACDSLAGMSAFVEIRNRFRQAIAPIFGSVLVMYFSYHMVQGDHGLIAYLHLKAGVDEAEARYVEVHAQRLTLEHRVALLRPDNLDPDMLEERARVMLDFIHPNEIVIPILSRGCCAGR